MSSHPCTVHYSAQPNLYNPADQVRMFVLHSASNAYDAPEMNGVDPVSCPGGFYSALFVGDSIYEDEYANDNTNIAGQTNTDIDDLVGFRHGNGPVTLVDFSGGDHASEDRYELWTKAIMLYNGFAQPLDNHSYAKILKYMKYNEFSKGNSSYICHTCKYVIEIKQAFMPDNLRTYIWKGDDEDGDGSHDWCFAFGEEEWVSGETVLDASGNSQMKMLTDYRNEASLNENLQIQLPCN